MIATLARGNRAIVLEHATAPGPARSPRRRDWLVGTPRMRFERGRIGRIIRDSVAMRVEITRHQHDHVARRARTMQPDAVGVIDRDDLFAGAIARAQVGGCRIILAERVAHGSQARGEIRGDDLREHGLAIVEQVRQARERRLARASGRSACSARMIAQKARRRCASDIRAG